MNLSFHYDVPAEVIVEGDESVRIVRLNRPGDLNAANHVLHRGDRGCVRTARCRSRSKSGRRHRQRSRLLCRRRLRLPRRAVEEPGAARQTIDDGRRIVTGMVGCRHPIVAAVNGPAVGLGCSIVALSDVVYMAETAHLADPHLLVGLVAADGAAVTWPLLVSLQLAKEYALTGDRIPAARAAEIGLANHVVPEGEVLGQALACAKRIATLPRQATEDTKRLLNMPLERAVSAALDFAFAAEDRSFVSPEVRANLDRLLERRGRS